jgi:hypothetical protein
MKSNRPRSLARWKRLLELKALLEGAVMSGLGQRTKPLARQGAVAIGMAMDRRWERVA